MKTFDDTRRDAIKLWIKHSRGDDVDGPYTLLRFELNCGANRIHALSVTKYGATREPLASYEGEKWQIIAPDTLAETLHNGACEN